MHHVPRPHPFKGQIVLHRQGLAVINRNTKYEVPTITCIEDLKGNANVKILVLSQPLGDLCVTLTHRVHVWLNGKCIVEFLFSLALTTEAQLNEICQNRRFLNWWGTLSANFR